MRRDPYRVALRRFSDASSVPRAILIDRLTLEPSIVGSLYEASLSRRCSSPNTFYRYLQFAQALLSWDREVEAGLEHRLLSGAPLSSAEIETYALWLEARFRGGSDAVPRRSIDSYNGYLRGAEEMVAWFMDQYFVADGADQGISLENQHRASLRSWRRVRKKRVAEDIAPDLEDEDVEAIENFLRGTAIGPHAEPRWTRAYLIWRLAIEFGLRIGEILALRLEDCPTRADPSFRIVRIEDRTGEPDPRGIYAPRPKTLGRALAPVIANTSFPHLVVDYQADHRRRKIVRASGQVVLRPVMSHTFLLVNDQGEPLSIFSARSLAQAIAAETKIEFTWHLARHAFFNRAYAAIARLDDPTARTTRTQDLVYWGGWRNESSLDAYVRRARRDRARTALAIWGGAHETWEALA